MSQAGTVLLSVPGITPESKPMKTFIYRYAIYCVYVRSTYGYNLAFKMPRSRSACPQCLQEPPGTFLH